jgi:glycosyltransferase involved in cell wall biosynthesis
LEDDLKIAIIVPSNVDCSPNRIVGYICEYLSSHSSVDIMVFYLRDVKKNRFPFPVHSKKLSVRSLFELNKFDVLHSNLLRADLLVALFGKVFDVATISTLHSQYDYDLSTYMDKSIKYRFVKWLWESALKRIDYLVPVSKSLGFFYEKKFPLSNVSPIQNGFPFCDLNKILQTRNTMCEYDVGIVSRIHKGKGVEDAIDACRIDNNLSLAVVGDGDLKLSLEKNAPLNVSFLGYIERPLEVYQKFSLFIMPSRNEGFGMTVLESISSGTPVLCYDTKVNREILGDGDYYYKSIEHLVELIHKYRGNTHAVYMQQSEVVGKFSIVRMSIAYLELYTMCKNT